MKEFWNSRYAEQGFAYGQEPNQYFKQKLPSQAGKLLLAAEGEGRNAIFAARAGWEVSAFDISEQGKVKADAWAKSEGLIIDYQVDNLENLHYPTAYFDAVGLIYAHLPSAQRRAMQQHLATLIKPQGWLIVEGFSQRHLDFNRKNPSVGGPKEADMLLSLDELSADFSDFELLEAADTDIFLSEGKYHQGQGAVIRLLARKR